MAYDAAGEHKPETHGQHSERGGAASVFVVAAAVIERRAHGRLGTVS
jgi:hypothetical protein